MIHPGLWKLICLQWKGGFRQFLNSLRTFRGLFQLAFTLFGIAVLVFSSFLSNASGASPMLGVYSQLNDFLAPALFLLTFSIILFSTGEGAVYFTPAEVAFLFPAPMTRRQLMAYKQWKNLIAISILSLVFAAMTWTRVSVMPFRYVGIFLTLWFTALLALNVAFARQLLQQRVHAAIRLIVGLLICVLIVVATREASDSGGVREFMKSFRESTAGAILLTPFQLCIDAMRVSSGTVPFFIAIVILLVMDLVLLFLAFQLDAWSLENAVAVSEKVAAKVKLIQRKGIWQAFGTAPSARTRVPIPPFLAGVGPVAWQRTMTVLRSTTSLAWTLGGALVLAAGAMYLMARDKQGAMIAPIIGVVVMGYVSFFVCLTIQNDIDRVAFLKSLPLRSTSVVVGDLIALPILVALIQALFIVGEAGFFPEHATALMYCAPLALPFNLLIFGVDKLVFYVYPTRMGKATPGDFQQVGKQMIFMTLKMLMLGVFATVAGIAITLSVLLLESPIATFATAGIVLTVECVSLIPLLTIAYNRFDPGVTQVN